MQRSNIRQLHDTLIAVVNDPLASQADKTAAFYSHAAALEALMPRSTGPLKESLLERYTRRYTSYSKR